MEKETMTFIDLLTSDSLMMEVMYGLLKGNPDDADSVLFSDAFSVRPDQDVICRWIAIPKSIIAHAEPLGTGYCRDRDGFPLPQPHHYVRLSLRKPQDKVGAALIQLLAGALQKIGTGGGSCGCRATAEKRAHRTRILTNYVATCTFYCSDGSSVTTSGSGTSPAAARTDAENTAILEGCDISGYGPCTITP